MIQYLLFDLDDTLYPFSSAMGPGITGRMISFVARHLNIDAGEAAARRKRGLALYGTTLEWLLEEHHVDASAFLDYVHPESELSELSFDPELRPFLLSLGLPLAVLTNSPMVHALRVLRFFKIEDVFTGIYDIMFNKLKGKPHASAYHNAVHAAGFSIEETAFFDDSPRYVAGFCALGGKGALVGAHEADGLPRIESIYGVKEFLNGA
jgi:putative hydrolase of the HAD superfamily